MQVQESKLKSRKLWWGIAALTASTTLAFRGVITPEQWIELFRYLSGFYLVTQGSIDLITKLKGR